MANATHVIGLERDELPAVRSLVALLRHSDPKIGELARQALYYLEEIAAMGIQPDVDRIETSINLVLEDTKLPKNLIS